MISYAHTYIHTAARTLLEAELANSLAILVLDYNVMYDPALDYIGAKRR